MTVAFKGNAYNVTDESVYCDFIIPVTTINEGVGIITDIEDVKDYTFNLIDYNDMTLKKRMLVLDNNGVSVKVSYMRKR